MAEYKANFNCPGCGSPLETPEGIISLQCKYCGLFMRIGSPGRILKYFYNSEMDNFAVKFAAERHFKKNGLSLKFTGLKSQLYYLPFYRFRGMSYALLAESIVEFEGEYGSQIPLKKRKYENKCRHFDLTIPANSANNFGLESLGVRPSVIPLTVLQNDNFPQGSIKIDIDINPEKAKENSFAMFFFNLGIAAENKECISTEMIGEGLSLIYYPVWAYDISRNGMNSTLLIDGLNKDVFNEIPGEFKNSAKNVDLSDASELKMVKHKCPNCGADFPVSEWSLFYHCVNCFKSYMIDNDDYRRCEFHSAVFEPGQNYHPFWRFPFALKGDIGTVSKFSKVLTGEIPLIVKSKAENLFYLYVPAFKTANLSSLKSLGVRVCNMQPELNLETISRNPSAEMILPEDEAVELSRYYWNLMRSKYQHLQKENFDIENCKLGEGEIVWLSLSRVYKPKHKISEKKSHSYV